MIKSLNIAMQVRFITISTKMQGEMQLGRIFNKVMRSDRTKKNFNESGESYSMPGHFSKPGKVTTHKNRRVTILNKVFMKYITGLMATGEVGSKLINKGIEISHVNVASDFSVVNVYWFSQSGDITHESIGNLLKALAGHLQHELTQLRLIGLVPPINFIKNNEFSIIKEVEDRLAKVDFGEDYTPTAHIPSAKVPTLEISLSEELRAQISQVDGTDCDSSNDKKTYKIVIPAMRQDVMGFDHSAVMKKVMTSVNKSRIAQQNQNADVPSEPIGCEEPMPGAVIDFLSSREQNKLFTDFLKKRKIEDKKRKRSENLVEVKRQDEMNWFERMNDDWEYMEDIDIDDKDTYDNDLSSKDH